MPNRLGSEHSPYLRQHANNPVNWFPWSQQVLDLAQAENKPIFLSIGYAACHWCHVMAHESFEDPRIADFLNAHFVSIKVDREERPDIDSLYMHAVTALTGHGGWPLSVFLTPQGLPFYGGTYFPPEPRHGMPAFMDVLSGVYHYWKDKPEAAQILTTNIVDHLSQSLQMDRATAALDPMRLVNIALNRLASDYDWTHGGWGTAPKFPQPMSLLFLLDQPRSAGNLPLVTHNLDQMMKGGMADRIGGGFHRYSVDDDWLVPHFEKMLYDNAQLALAYASAFHLTGNPDYKSIATDTLDFMLREMRHPSGGFYSSLDADTPQGEGYYYTWSYDEVRAALPDERTFQMACSYYGFSPNGVFEGRSIPRVRLSMAELAALYNLSPDECSAQVRQFRAVLLQARRQRTPPAIDTKILTSWNALAISAFARASRMLNRPDYLEVAASTARFILAEMTSADRLYRIWHEGTAVQSAFLEDYAGLALALLQLQQADGQWHWVTTAEHLMETILTEFRHPQNGFYDDSNTTAALFLRPRELQDNAVPSGSGLAITVLLYLSELLGRNDYRAVAEESLQAIQQVAMEYPTSFAQWLCAADFSARAVHIVLAGKSTDSTFMVMRNLLVSQPTPNALIAIYPTDRLPDEKRPPAYLPNCSEKPAVYICRNFACERPIENPERLIQALQEMK